MPSIIQLLVLGGIIFTVVSRYFKKRAVQYIPGPSSPSWVFGNMGQLLLPKRYGQYEFAWQRQYGGLYRLKGCFGEDRLMVSDPAALKHILHDPATFERSTQQQEMVNMLIGTKAVFYVKGDDHRRIRNIMNAAFAPSSIRALPPTFAGLAEKVGQKWQTMISENKTDTITELYHTIHDSTLDGVGEGAIGYRFGALDQEDNEFAKSHQNIITFSGVRTKTDIIFDAVVPWVPQRLVQAAFSLPTHAFRALQHNREVGARISRELVESQIEAVSKGNETGKDLLNVMVRSNASARQGHKMTEEEMQEQIPSLMIAGQDTTGNTLSMCLYELSKNQKTQAEIRQEINEHHEACQVKGLPSYNGIENLPLLNAFIKEVLRMHPGLPMSDRVASRDCVIPLSEPITCTNGEKITELPVSKGQHFIIGTASYNRLQSVWGKDADEFKPSRWLNGDPAKAAAFGPYAGLATFFGGPRTCIGWRFAVTEIQVFLSVNLPKFNFRLHEKTVIEPGVAVTLVPVCEGKMSLPLIVTLVED